MWKEGGAINQSRKRVGTVTRELSLMKGSQIFTWETLGARTSRRKVGWKLLLLNKTDRKEEILIKKN